VVAQLAQDRDGLERLRVLAAQEGFDGRRRDEEAVQGELELGQAAEDDVLVLDGDCERVCAESAAHTTTRKAERRRRR